MVTRLVLSSIGGRPSPGRWPPSPQWERGWGDGFRRHFLQRLRAVRNALRRPCSFSHQTLAQAYHFRNQDVAHIFPIAKFPAHPGSEVGRIRESIELLKVITVCSRYVADIVVGVTHYHDVKLREGL